MSWVNKILSFWSLSENGKSAIPSTLVKELSLPPFSYSYLHPAFMSVQPNFRTCVDVFYFFLYWHTISDASLLTVQTSISDLWGLHTLHPEIVSLSQYPIYTNSLCSLWRLVSGRLVMRTIPWDLSYRALFKWHLSSEFPKSLTPPPSLLCSP